ncbi:MAG TPA: hypothetical protein VFS21_35110 [Roseiflexaceae bacterium]|nr:hypothetical protein [Roseiflexaceae bacterium]
MRDFSQFAQQTGPRYPSQRALWTVYHLETHPYPRCGPDWGVCLAYHFDRGVHLRPWLELAEAVRAWIEAQTALEPVVQFVPFYEVGSDFFAQPKPPYNGGYHTEMYEEFLRHGSCEPAPWFFGQLAELHRSAAEALRAARNSAWQQNQQDSGTREALVRRVAHATLITPYRHLFWRDEEGWAVYQPSIGAEDVREWVERGG